MELHSAIVAPLLAPGNVLGGLVLAYTHSGRQFGPDDLNFADELARRAALGLENARLFSQTQALNADLEARVQRRTTELLEANASLEAEVAERKRVESELDGSREQLRSLTAHLQAAREEERARISREIHDELGGALTGLKMDVAAIGRHLDDTDDKRQARLDALMAQIDATVSTVRRIATDLRPALLDDFGLAAAMEWQLTEFKERAGIEGQFETNVDDVAWNAEGSIALFRIFQEALTNVARHAQASRVEVRLTRQGEELNLTVRDDGRGISAGKCRGEEPGAGGHARTRAAAERAMRHHQRPGRWNPGAHPTAAAPGEPRRNRQQRDKIIRLYKMRLSC